MDIRIETKRLTLRSVSYSDLDEVERMWKFEKGRITANEARNAIDWMANNHQRNKIYNIEHLCLAVFEKGRENIIGWCGLDGGVGGNKDRAKIVIFYLIDDNYRNIGYATESGKALLEYGFETMKIKRIYGGCAEENIASRKVLEAIGMKHMKLREDGSPDYYLEAGGYGR
ncbi:MAG: GNAT family N-acetyltransferase [Bacteroidetes bacterium]|nr:GNAT family N-acetyltransferase [Bacteroidota bacterium]